MGFMPKIIIHIYYFIVNRSVIGNAAIYTCPVPNSKDYIFFQLFDPKMSHRKNADLINSGKPQREKHKLSKNTNF